MMVKRILAIDATTEACSVALYCDGNVDQIFELAPRRHTELILPMVQTILANSGTSMNQLDAIAVDQGPGSFTGVRITAGVAQGLAFAVEKPLIPISSLAAMAYAAHQELGTSSILATIDARMSEIYWGLYSCSVDSVKLQGEEKVDNIAQIVNRVEHECVAVGTGIQTYLSDIETMPYIQVDLRESLLYPKAESIAMLASRTTESTDWITPEKIEPVYLRNNIAQTIK